MLKTSRLGRDTFDIKWLTQGILVSVKGRSFGEHFTLVQLATVTVGMKWVVNETRLRALNLDVNMELLQTYLEEV